MFDEATARARFLSGIPANRTSTQSWDVETWSADWRGTGGELRPGALGAAGGAWWFRAITESGRLTAEPGEISSELLTGVGARARIAAFVGDANQILVHWPLSALAPIAFPLREALGLNEALAVLAESLPHGALAPYVDWLGPVDIGVGQRWMQEFDDPAVIAALGVAGGDFATALDRLTDLGALAEATTLALASPTPVHAAWVVKAGRPVTLDLLFASLETVDDPTFVSLAEKVLRKRDRRLWETLAARPLAALAAKVLDQLGEPVAPWVFRFFESGADPMIDVLIELALGRGKRAKNALRVLSHLDRTAVRLRIDAEPAEKRAKLLAKLQPEPANLPELPRAVWPSWMNAVSQRAPVLSEEWLDAVGLPQLRTRSGHRLPTSVQLGILALLQEVRFDVGGQDETADRYDSALDELHGLLEPDSANAWWNALFAMWWTNHRPEVRWVMYAAAFMCDGSAIRDLGAKLRRHQTWFGNLSSRVIAALGHNPTPWAVAALDDIVHRSSNATHRQIATTFLKRRADAAGVTVDRFVAFNYPDEADPVLIAAAARRTELSMVEQRAWNEFLLREHLKIAPFKYVGEAVVWCVTDSWGEAVAFFRVEDRQLIDVDGEQLDVDVDHTITVAHPAQLKDDDLLRWHEYCADHEIVQPFGQLERARYRASSLSRDGFQSPVGASVLGREFVRRAETHGWHPVRTGAHGDIVGVAREFEAMDVRGLLRFRESLAHDGGGESAIAGIEFSSLSGDRLDALDVHCVAFSETHHDLSQLMVKTQ